MPDSSMKKGSPDSVWLRPTRKSRTDRPQLSQERIIHAAIELLDEQGLEGLSLRRLADRLGSGVTSLYWYVDTKEDLLELAVDAILGEVPYSIEPSTGWRADISALAVGLRTIILRHPWSASLFANFLGIGPNALAYSEVVLRVLDQLGLSNTLLDGALSAVFYYVIGSAITDAAWVNTLRRAGLDNEGWEKLLEENVRKADESQLPWVAGYVERFGEDNIEQRFQTGLDAILDGLEQWAGREADQG